MIRHIIYQMVCLALLAAPGPPAEEVDPFIGAGGLGYGAGSTFPGPSIPFGMARPGPDTARLGSHVSFHHCSGYHYLDNQVRGFSHTRLSGIGVVEYGNVLLMPTMKFKDDYLKESSYRVRFSHQNEEARPGYYSVVLDPGIKVELTATRHCGLHRYTFPDERGRVVVDAAHAMQSRGVCGASIEVHPGRKEISGMALNCGRLTGRDKGVEIFFAARFSRDFDKWEVFNKKKPGASKNGEAGPAGAWVELDTRQPVTAAVGLSFISAEQARRHLATELSGKSFQEVRDSAANAWSDALSVIEVEGGSPEERAVFYTALYHCMIMPTEATEAGGLYRGLDGEVHEARGFSYYTDFSLWDTFRTLHPLLNLIMPERSADMMQSLLMMAEQGGYMPKWPTAYRYSSCMIGASADNALADAYVKGVRGFDAERAYQKSRWMAMHPVPESAGYEGRAGVREYIEKGYVPSDKYDSAASRTIEFSYNDWCLSNLAGALGKNEDRDMFMARSRNWRNLWDKRTGSLRGRSSDGSFSWPFLPWAWTAYYVEGNARQWLWAPWHDVQGMIELMGGKAGFARRLDEFFHKSAARPDTILPDTFYWHGNEPDIHAAYLFNFAQRPELTRKWVQWIMREKYDDTPAGLDGNDDCGTLSAWYVFSALGFYPVAGSDTYLLGSPLFGKATLHLQEGDLVIRKQGEPDKGAYFSEVLLNNKRLYEPWFKHQDIAGGGEIVFKAE